MTDALQGLDVADGAAVSPALMAQAVTAAVLEFGDGATQVFRADGTTTYVEGGRDTFGEWTVGSDGSFCSFWPPSYRACYELTWIVEADAIVGLRFVEQGRGSVFEGRYER